MDTKKDIGQFFKDNLNQMDFTPNDKGWDKIEEELQEKKKKRRAFFWLYFTAFLAGSIFTLLLVYGTDLFPSNSENGKNRANSVAFENGNSNSKTSNTNSNGNQNATIDSELKQLNRSTSNEVSSVDYKLESKNTIKNSNSNNSNANKTKSDKINRKNSKTSINGNYNLTNTSNYKISKIKSKNKKPF